MSRGRVAIAATGLALLITAGCASDQKAASPQPSRLASSQVVTPDRSRSDSWTYNAPGVNLARYKRFIVAPAEIYRGSEADFGSADVASQQRYAAILTEELRRALGERYPIVGRPAQDVAVLKLTLIGVEPTVSGVATASRVLPVGAIANLAKSAAGDSGSFTGSLKAAIEAFDSVSGKLVAAAIRRQAPAVFDIEATLSTEDTVRAAARSLGVQVREAVDRHQGR